MSWSNITGRMDEAIMGGLSDGQCEYQGVEAGAIAAPYLLERDIQLFDDDGPARIATTIDLRSKDIGRGKTKKGDLIITPSRTWRVLRVLNDDGYWRKLEVT